MGQKQEIKFDGLSKNLNVVLNHMDIAEITELMNEEFPENLKPSQGYLEYLLCKAIREYKNVNFFEVTDQDSKDFETANQDELGKKKEKLYDS